MLPVRAALAALLLTPAGAAHADDGASSALPTVKEVTHRLDCRGFFSWLGYPFLRRACSVFLRRSNAALEKHFRRTTVQSRYARPSGRRA